MSMFASLMEDATDAGLALFNGLDHMAGTQLNVGILENYYDNGASTGDVAAYHEYGTSTHPATPFLEPTMAESADLIKERFSTILSELVKGGSPEEALKELGDELAAKVRQRILDIPLFDTGLLSESVAATVTPRSSQ